jgi:Kef-type K+ transport system membrane component KefB/nucleotide-binding universal stress UspA family protein
MSLFAVIAPISGHAVFLLLVQLALLLFVARLGANVARLFGLPAVVGELAAGIVLGPSVFGHYFPEAFVEVFPQTSAQFHLLETVGVLGMVLLLLLTGLETDLKLLRNLGRAAVVASILGMVVPFGLGFGLGMWMPDNFLAQPDRRVLFAAFLATAMAISAMPVIAKILMDLDLTRRNIGLVILSAGVVDDTAGWLVLSAINGAATQGGQVRFTGLGITLGLVLVFMVGIALVAYPLMRGLTKLIVRAGSTETELVMVVVFALLCAALTEWIGVHAVFGAFIAGTALRQVPHLRSETVHRLESFVFSILAPVFFGVVGLQVDLWSLSGGDGGLMLGIVLGIACLGKLVGCTLGGIWGGLRTWEAISIAVAMNARGAMGLVAASIGLSLGILNQQMFSIIVVVAIATSFVAPVALRLTMRRVKMTRDEEQRMLAERSRGVFDLDKLRLLVPTAGGPNALYAAEVAFGLAKRSANAVEILYVDEKGTAFDRIFRLFGQTAAGKNLEQHLAKMRELAGGKEPRILRVTGRAAATAVVEEAAKGFDVILMGASGGATKVGGRVLEEIVDGAPCHVAIVRAGKDHRPLKHVFVPIDGSFASRTAAEFALHYAEAAGGSLTLGILSDRPRGPMMSHGDAPDVLPDVTIDESDSTPPQDVDGVSGGRGDPSSEPPPRPSDLPSEAAGEELARISPVFRISTLKPRIVRIDYDPGLGGVADVIMSGGYDLVVLGAENRAVRKRLFFGHENRRIIDLDAVTTAILVPSRGR